MSTSPTDVSVLYELKFSQLFEHLVQQQQMRFPQTFKQGNYRGSKSAQVVKQIASIEVDERTVRFEQWSLADVGHDARWIGFTPFDKYVGFDTWDEVMTMADPRSSYAEAVMMGMNRKKDKACLNAFFADARTGEQGASTTTFATGGGSVAVNFGASGNTHLTLAKIKEGKRILMANEVDIENDELFVSARALDIDSLMNEVQVTSADFHAGGNMVLQDGKVTRVFGVNIVHSEQHATSASNTLLAMWARSGMQYGVWQDVQTRIFQDMTRRGFPWIVGTTAMFGATRLQEKKVVQILSITA